MNIGFYAGSLFTEADPLVKDLVVSTISFISKQNAGHKSLIFSDYPAYNLFPELPGIDIIHVRPKQKNLLQKSYWWDVKLPAALKKMKVSTLVSFDAYCSVNTSVRQLLIITDGSVIKNRVKKADSLLVISDELKERLIRDFSVEDSKISVIKPAISDEFKPVNQETKENVKREYTRGKEFFLCNGSFRSQEDFTDVLKAFSKFKRRMQSNLQIIFFSTPSIKLLKKLESYKYRDDVKLILPDGVKQAALLTASAYAVMIQQGIGRNLVAALQAMKCGVPVINLYDSVKNKITTEINNAGREKSDDAEKMYRLYADENYRNELIEKGINEAADFSPEKTAEQIWQSVLKTIA
jgi:glycosyltransferase involved in cell wall biosynthesis